MKQKNEQVIRWIFLILYCLVMITGNIVLLGQKEALYPDEYYSYGCSNGLASPKMTFKSGATYTGDELKQVEQNACMTGEGNCFCFGNCGFI